MIGLAMVPLTLVRCGGGCEGGGGTGLPGDLALNTPAAGSYHDCGFSVEMGVATSPYAQIREDSGTCLRMTITVTGSEPPYGGGTWANPLTGAWHQAMGIGSLGGASFTVQAADNCIVQLQYNATGSRTLASDDCA